jgi:hypothetical protein
MPVGGRPVTGVQELALAGAAAFAVVWTALGYWLALRRSR